MAAHGEPGVRGAINTGGEKTDFTAGLSRLAPKVRCPLSLSGTVS